MPFSWPLALALYFTIWWITLLAVLPIGAQSPDEVGETRREGTDPGAPVAPQLGKKAALTTVIALAEFGLIALVAKYLA